MKVEIGVPAGTTRFDSLKLGDVFELGAYAFIKTGPCQAFNTFLNQTSTLNYTDSVTACPRAVLILNPGVKS